MQELKAKDVKRNIDFHNYCARHIKKGDKTRLCHLLNMSYPTLMLHMTGFYDVPEIQSQIMDYFEKRSAANRRAVSYIEKRLKQVDQGYLTAEDIPENSTPF